MKYIITENQLSNLFVRRRLKRFGQYVRSTYKWLNPKAFDDYDEFFTRVVFRSLDNFLSAERVLDYGTLNKIRGESIPFMTEFIEKEYGDEIREYFDMEISK